MPPLFVPQCNGLPNLMGGGRTRLHLRSVGRLCGCTTDLRPGHPRNAPWWWGHLRHRDDAGR